MISQPTADAILEVMVDWCNHDPNTMNDLLVLLDRIGQVKGNRSFTQSVDALYHRLKHAIPEPGDVFRRKPLYRN